MSTVVNLLGALPAAQGGGSRPEMLWIGLLLMLVVFYGIMFSGSRKEKKKRREMLAAMKKGDRVMTIGGIIGTILNVKEDEIVLKVDETTNTKITFVRGAIQKVLSEDEKPTMEQR